MLYKLLDLRRFPWSHDKQALGWGWYGGLEGLRPPAKFPELVGMGGNMRAEAAWKGKGCGTRRSRSAHLTVPNLFLKSNMFHVQHLDSRDKTEVIKITHNATALLPAFFSMCVFLRIVGGGILYVVLTSLSPLAHHEYLSERLRLDCGAGLLGSHLGFTPY